MSEDHELQQMFLALRRSDEERAPAFEEMETPPQTVHRRGSGRTRPAAAYVALWVTALSVVPGVAIWLNHPQPRDGAASTTTDLQTLDQICDSLLATVTQLDAESQRDAQHEDMVWQAATDALMPFESLHDDERESR